MPSALAMVTCLFFICGSAMLAVAVLPMGGWTDERGPLAYEDFWKSGRGVVAVSLGVAFILLANGFFRGWRWVQTATPLILAVMTAYCAWHPDPKVPYEWTGTLVWAVISYWYLNRKRRVVEYFDGQRTTN